MHTKVGYVRCGSTPQVERTMGAEGTPVIKGNCASVETVSSSMNYPLVRAMNINIGNITG